MCIIPPYPLKRRPEQNEQIMVSWSAPPPVLTEVAMSVLKAHFCTLAQPNSIFAPSGQRGDDLAELLLRKSSEGLAPDVALHGSR
jgi:hypothetical protein